MGNMSFFETFVAVKLRDLHCGYIGRVIWTDGATATVQPLGMLSVAEARAVVSDVPVACRYKLAKKTLKYTDANGDVAEQTVAVPEEIAKGDIVACLCADWDISEARRGNNAVPPSASHSINDSIIVGIL